VRSGNYSTSALAILAAALIVLGGALIFVVEWIGAPLVIAGTIVGFVVLVRFMREQLD